jgi:gluconolactonase
MKTISLRIALLLLLMLLCVGDPLSRGEEKAGYPIMGTIERKDPRFDKLIPQNAVLEKLADGFSWTEGPVWVHEKGHFAKRKVEGSFQDQKGTTRTWIPEGGYLLFSDIPRNTVFRWKEGQNVSIFLQPSGYTGKTPRGGEPGSNALILDPEGRLVLMEHGDRCVARLDKMSGTSPRTVLADRYEGKRLNSPNDGVFKSNGDFYFTDPPYGLEKSFEDPARELDFCGVYRLAKDGKLTLLTKEMSAPNGIAFSPDEKTLYVSNSDPKKAIWMAFDVKEDGTLGSGRVFFDSTDWVKTRKGLPDGMKVDKDGILFATGPGGVHVFTPDGTLLGTIDTGEKTANCGWGNDGSVLYIMADHNICRIKTSTKGKGF